MKKSIKRSIGKVLLVLSVIVFTSCEKDFDEINTDPNTPSAEVIPVDNMFLGLLTNIASETNNETMAIISDLFGFAFPSGIAAYEVGTASKWGMYSSIKNVNQLIELTGESGNSSNVVNNGVAKILRVIYYQRLVDLFGAIPYFEGGQGLKFPQPKYDSEEVIYKDLVKELDAAVATINSGSSGVYGPGVDLVYSGNSSKWVVFANSLKLRIGMRMRFVDPVTASKVITESLSATLMSSNEDSWNFKYPGSEASNSSGFFSTTSPSNRFVSELMFKKLRESSDPRKFAYADPAGLNKTIYQGQVNGLNVNFDDGAQSTRSAKMWQDRTFPAYLMTYSEVNFLKAEAALASIGSGNANVEYRKGIRASMEQWGVAEADITTYLATPEATLSGNEENQLKQIAIQKWISLYTNGHEAYAEMRRTGYPAIAQRSASGTIQRLDAQGNLQTIEVGYRLGTTEGIFPRRVEYPTSEKELNPTNYTAAVNTYGNGLLDKVWWDVR